MRWESSVDIDAPASRVWELNVDVAQWPRLTPTVTRLERLDGGPFRVGSRAKIKQPAQSEAVWTVTRLEPGRVFSWQTRRMGLTMTGTHQVTAAGDGCRNTLSLDVEGRGSRVFGLLLGPLLRRTLDTENAGFKKAAELKKEAEK